MNSCKLCKKIGNHKTVDSRVINGVRYRRKKCACGKLTISKEIRVSAWPAKPLKKKQEKQLKATPEPTMHFNGIEVTKESPDWLKRVATLIEQLDF
jgi:hypothetical protein